MQSHHTWSTRKSWIKDLIRRWRLAPPYNALVRRQQTVLAKNSPCEIIRTQSELSNQSGLVMFIIHLVQMTNPATKHFVARPVKNLPNLIQSRQPRVRLLLKRRLQYSTACKLSSQCTAYVSFIAQCSSLTPCILLNHRLEQREVIEFVFFIIYINYLLMRSRLLKICFVVEDRVHVYQ